MSKNSNYSSMLELVSNDNEYDVIWIDFDTLEELQAYNDYINTYYNKDDVVSIGNYKFIYSINKMIELDCNSIFDNELVVA